MSISIKKWKPWNWFRREHEQEGAAAPARTGGGYRLPSLPDDSPLAEFHREIDGMFDRMFERMTRQFGQLAAPGWPREAFPLKVPGFLLKPDVDIREDEKSYTITAEVPGVEEKDIRLELSGNTLTLSGEKRKSEEKGDANYHCVERSYGAFRRMLALPDDADADNIEAAFRDGVLTVTVPRKHVAKSEDTKVISIRRAA